MNDERLDLLPKEDRCVLPVSVVSVIEFRKERMVVVQNDARILISRRSFVGAKFGARIAPLIESFGDPGDL